MNRIARALGSPLAFGAGVVAVIALLIIGEQMGWRSSAFDVARTLMRLATFLGLMVVLWSHRRRFGQIAGRRGSQTSTQKTLSALDKSQ